MPKRGDFNVSINWSAAMFNPSHGTFLCFTPFLPWLHRPIFIPQHNLFSFLELGRCCDSPRSSLAQQKSRCRSPAVPIHSVCSAGGPRRPLGDYIGRRSTRLKIRHIRGIKKNPVKELWAFVADEAGRLEIRLFLMLPMH